MTVQWQLKPLPLGQGIDNNSSRASLPPGKLLQLINGQFAKDGGLTKRSGFSRVMTAFAALPTVAGTAKTDLIAYTGQLSEKLIARSNTTNPNTSALYDYSAKYNGFVSKGFMSACPISAQIVKSGSTDFQAMDSYTTPSTGYTCTVWFDGANVNYSITDQSSSTTINAGAFSGTLVANPTDLQVLGVDVGTTAYFYVRIGRYIYRASKTVFDATFSTGSNFIYSTPFADPGGVLTGYVAGRMCLNGYYTAYTGFAFVGLYANGGTNNSAVVTAYTSAGALISGFPVTRVLTSTFNNLSPLGLTVLPGASTQAYVIGYWGIDGFLHGASFSVLNGTVLGQNTLAGTFRPKHIAVGQGTGNLAFVYADEFFTWGTYAGYVQSASLSYSGVWGGAFTFARGASLASDAILVSNVGFLALTYYSKVTGALSSAAASKYGVTTSTLATLNSVTLLVDASKNVYGRILRGSALQTPNLPSMSIGSKGIAFVTRALSQTDISISLAQTLALGGVAFVVADILNPKARGVSVFSDVVVSGGYPTLYDGNAPTELGFNVYPEITYAHSLNKGTRDLFSVMAVSASYNSGDIVFGPPGTSNVYATSPCQAHVYLCVVPGTTIASFALTQMPTDGSTFSGFGPTWQDLGAAMPNQFAAAATFTYNQTFTPSGVGAQSQYIYCVIAGAPRALIAGDEPVWPTTVGGTVVKNGLTWLCMANYAQLAFPYNTFMSSQGYTYQVVYAWLDDQGETHRSAASIPNSTSMDLGTGNIYGANSYLAITTLRQTTKNNVRIEVYRTAGNGTVCQLIAVLPNNPNVDLVGFQDYVTDTQQSLGRLIYQGAFGSSGLPNVPPPACNSIATFNGRLVANSTEFPFQLFPSKLLFAGEGVAWADALASIPLNGAYGSVRALIQMDVYLLIFQDHAVSYITGDGPDNTGGGVAYADPRPIATDVGCIYPDSVVLTPVGVFFQSAKGMHLVGRNLTTAFVGEAVVNRILTPVTTAVVDPTTHQVLFLCANGLFIYDWTSDSWATWTLVAPGLSSLQAYSSSLVVADTAGNISMQVDGTYHDVFGGSDSSYLFIAEIASVRLADAVSGFARIRGAALQFLTDGNAEVAVDINRDYRDTSLQEGQQYTTTSVTLDAGQDNIIVRNPHRRAESFSMVIYELTPGDGQLILEGITLEIGVEGGLNRRPASKRIF